MRKFLPLCAAPLLLAACSTWSPSHEGLGADQVVYVRTVPEMSAFCILTNNAGSWNVYSAPQHIDIDKAAGKLTVKCRSPKGYTGETTVGSEADPSVLIPSVAVAGAVWAVGTTVNPPAGAAAVAGAATGAGIVSAGSQGWFRNAWNYPKQITVTMHRDGEPEIVPAPATAPEPPEQPAAAPRRVRHWVRHVRHAVRHHAAPACSCAAQAAPAAK